MGRGKQQAGGDGLHSACSESAVACRTKGIMHGNAASSTYHLVIRQLSSTAILGSQWKPGGKQRKAVERRAELTLQENTTEPDGQKRIPEERVWRRNIYSS